MSNMSFRQIPDEEIEEALPFRLHLDLEIDRLQASLAAVGQISPLILWPHQGRLWLLCGARRRLALRALGRSVFAALILPEGTSEWEALQLAVEDNLGQRTFNEAEKVLVVQALSRFLPEEEIVNRYLVRLGIPPTRNFLHIFLGLAELGPAGLLALAEGRLDLETGERLSRMEEADRAAVIGLLEGLAPNRNKRRQILTWLEEISRRDGQSVAEIIQETDLQSVLEADNLSRPQKEERVRRLLKGRRFPHLTSLEEKKASLLAALALPPGIRLDWPQDFEGLGYTLRIDFTDLPELTQTLAQLPEIIAKPALTGLIELG